jgi:hypothetical protein
MDTRHEEVTITLRLPAAVAAGVQQAAREPDRSLNGAIVRALREDRAGRKRAK